MPGFGFRFGFFSGWTHARAAAKVVGLLAWSALLVPLQLVFLWRSRRTDGSDAYRITKLWHRGVCALLGIHVQIKGVPMRESRMVYVSNHVSHFDIPVLGSVLKGSFVAKQDMARWPIAGFMARLQQTVFISRDPRAGRAVTDSIAEQLRRGRSLILFPEGTTSDGSGVLPFKSTIFGILFAGDAGTSLALATRQESLALATRQESLALALCQTSARAVQPLTIRVLAVNDRPVCSQVDRDGYAFYGDMHAGLHAWGFLRSTGARIELCFADAITAQAGLERKELALRAHAAVLAGLAD